MDPTSVQLVQQSLGRCLLNRSADTSFLDAFYARFLESDPRVKPLFANTDMEKQKELLRHGIAMLIMFGGGSPMAKTTVEKLAERHDRDNLNIDPSLYRAWSTSLIASVKEYDPKCDATLIAKWNEVIDAGIQVMRQAY